MSNYGNSFFTPGTKEYPASTMPIWLEVKERKIAGGTFSLSGYNKGDIIAAGIPVVLGKMGGTATLLPIFKVVGAVSAEATTLVLKPLSGIIPVEDMVVGKIDATGKAAKAAALPAGTALTGTDAGKYSFTITANTFGALSDGDLLVIIKESGSNKYTYKPDGLSWREVNINGGALNTGTPTYGTVAVVTKGQILGDRINELPEYYKASLPGITFEYELS